MISKKFRFVAMPLLGAALLSACADGDDTVVGPPAVSNDLFARYVSLGNSITMGIQSAGINDSTQRLAYPVLFAAQAGAPFVVPSLAMPGCPPPLVGPLLVTQRRVGPADAPTCSLRSSPVPPVVSNLAVTGANIADALDPLGNPDPSDTFNQLQLFILGGQSMVQRAIQADPTLVTVALGSGDALGAALAGDPSLLTPLAAFRTSAERIADALADSTEARGVFIGAFNPAFVPFLQPGAYFFALRQAGRLPKPVNANCAPGSPAAGNLVSFNVLLDPRVAEINCADAAPLVLSRAEQGAIQQRVAQYNAVLAEVARARGFEFLDVNPIFLAQLGNPDAIRKCQGFATAATLQQFQQAVVNTCPGPTAPNFFGALFSFDAVHPSSLGQRLLANALIGKVNQAFGTSVPALAIPAF